MTSDQTSLSADPLDAQRLDHSLNTEAEAAFDDLVQLAATLCETPIALINWIAGSRQWLKAKVGIEMGQMPMNMGFCDDCLAHPDGLVIPDTLAHPEFAVKPMVTAAPHLRFYAGVPLINAIGVAVGTICVADQEPRQLRPEQLVGLQALGRQVVVQLELRRNIRDLVQTTISQQKTVAALRHSEERWQLAMRDTDDGIWDWHVQTNEVFFSARWKEMLGYAESEVTNQLTEWHERIHPDDVSKVMAAIADHLAQKTPFYTAEYRLRCQDGTYKWILDRGQAMWDDQGHPTRMVGSHTDITTTRRQMEEDLRRQTLKSQLFAEIALKIRQSLQFDEILQISVHEVQQLLNADRVLVFRLLSDGSGMVVQEAVVAGYPVVLKQILHDPCFSENYARPYQMGRVAAITDIDQVGIDPCHVEFLKQFAVRANLVVPILSRAERAPAVQTDQPSPGDAVRHPDDAAPSTATPYLWGLLIAHQCSAPRAWTPFETDLLQQLADQIGIALVQAELLQNEVQQRQALMRSNAELEQFAYVSSHDLQEPLRMVVSYLQLLQRRYKGKLEADADEFIGYAVDGASRMQALINDLLMYSRVNRRGNPFESVSLMTVLLNVLQNLQVALAESNAMITYDPLPEVQGDYIQLTQLFQNLLSNAIKFSFRGKQNLIHIGVIADDADGVWQFRVSDQGIGIEPQYLDRIFLIFQRLHNRTEYPGTGIGLAICKKIIEHHGGKIWAASEFGSGTTFHFTIPK
jgi:PAS domain S-box-containing protein